MAKKTAGRITSFIASPSLSRKLVEIRELMSNRRHGVVVSQSSVIRAAIIHLHEVLVLGGKEEPR